MFSITLIEQWARAMDARQFTEALVSVAVHEDWPCSVGGEPITWARWAQLVGQADPDVPAAAILELALACRAGEIEGEIINRLDLEACWAFEGDHEAFWRKWGQMLCRHGACLAGSLDDWMAQRRTLAVTQYTL